MLRKSNLLILTPDTKESEQPVALIHARVTYGFDVHVADPL